jgi:hypothetical protein
MIQGFSAFYLMDIKMNKFKRVPIEVEAMQVTIPFQPIVNWCGGTIYMEGPAYIGIIIDHFPRRHEEIANKEDWIIKFPEGYLVIMDNETFKLEFTEA